MRDPLHWLDVKRKLALTFVGVCLIAFGVGGSLAATSASSALEAEIRLRLQYQCRAWADALDSDLRLLTRRCEDFASDGYIRVSAAAAADPDPAGSEKVRADLRRHLAENKLPLVPAFTDLAILDAADQVLVTAGGAPQFVEAVASGSAAAESGAWHTGLLGEDAASGAPMQAIVVPIRSLDGARRIGRLVAWVRTDRWIVGALGSVERNESRRPESLELVVADAAGRQVAVPHVPVRDPSAAANAGEIPGLVLESAGKPGPGEDRLAARGSIEVRVPLAANGWSVQVRLTDPEALAPVSGLQAKFLLVGVALAAAIGVLLFFPMRFLARPLVELREAARRLQAGDLAVRVDTNTEDEIGDLGRSFNHMAEAVETRTLRMEDALRELAAQRDRLDAVIASMRDGLVVLDADGTAILSNAAAKPLLDLVAARDPRVSGHRLCDDARTSGTNCATCLFEPSRPMRSCVVDAGSRVLEIHATRLPPGRDGRSGRVLAARDVTERVAQDERQIHQERLSVLGEVAAVMAHELNNPLAAISMFSQMVDQGLGPGSAFREHLEVIRRNTDACKRAIRELLDYAAGAPPEIGEVDVNAVLEDVARFLRPLAERSNARIALDLRAAAPSLTGDEIQIRQIFVNLVVNALQAMGARGGEVTLGTRDGEGHLVVDVADTGPGVPEEARGRIFDPFFTTKSRGLGTGLGLSTSRRIAELHGGGVDLVETAPGRTVFRVRLRSAARETAAR